STLILSWATLSGQTNTQRYPFSAATMASATPVLPEVGSMIVPPGRSAPEASAASTMRSAIRSFTDPPGLKYSTLASTAGAPRPAPPSPRVTVRSLTTAACPPTMLRGHWWTARDIPPPGTLGQRAPPLRLVPARRRAPDACPPAPLRGRLGDHGGRAGPGTAGRADIGC